MSKVDILGVKFDDYTMSEVIGKIHEFVNDGGLHNIVTPNPEFVMLAQKDEKYMDILNNADLVVPDGIGIVIGSKLVGKKIKERVSGFDICTNLFKEKKYSFYFLGAKGEIVKNAMDNVNKEYDNPIKGCHNGYFKEGSQEEKDIIEDINKNNIDILLVALGTPRQEKWVNGNKDKISAKVTIGVGGTFDVLSGELKRAPEVYQKLGLEWLYRLIKQPSRIKRMLVIPKYLMKVVVAKKNI